MTMERHIILLGTQSEVRQAVLEGIVERLSGENKNWRVEEQKEIFEFRGLACSGRSLKLRGKKGSQKISIYNMPTGQLNSLLPVVQGMGDRKPKLVFCFPYGCLERGFHPFESIGETGGDHILMMELQQFLYEVEGYRLVNLLYLAPGDLSPKTTLLLKKALANGKYLNGPLLKVWTGRRGAELNSYEDFLHLPTLMAGEHSFPINLVL
jgi:hypothetical protein